MYAIDLNSDLGEQPAALADGSERQLLQLVSSANIACGGHAGDAASMKAVVKMCIAFGVTIGAHPGYPDPARFGRVRIDIATSRLEASIREQIEALVTIAESLGTFVHHVKPHGALYNAAIKDSSLAATIGRAVSAVDRNLVLVGLAGSAMLDVWRSAGLTAVGEAFADRRYEPDGTLRPRTFADALITNPDEAARQALTIVRDGAIVLDDGARLAVSAQTLCVHGDTENAVVLAREIRGRLAGAGIEIRPF